MSARSNAFWANSSVHSEERAISLSLNHCHTQPRLASIICRSGTQSDPCISSIRFRDHDCQFELPRSKGSGLPNRYHGVLLHTITHSGLARVRTELFPLLIIPLPAPHPVKTNRESTCHRHVRDLAPSPHRQVEISAAPLPIAPYCDLGRFHQQETHEPAPLFADMPEPSAFSARVFFRNQTQIGRDLLATLKPFRLSDDQHKGQGRQRTYSGMGHQSLRSRIVRHFRFDRLRQLRNRGVQSVQ